MTHSPASTDSRIRMILRPAALDEILLLRHTVLRPGAAFETARFEDDEKETTVHMGAFPALMPGSSHYALCCLSCMLHEGGPLSKWQLRGMATDPGHRGYGLGSELLALTEYILVRHSVVRDIWCNARTTAVSFYKRLGWKPEGDEFNIPDVGPHLKMVKTLVE